MTTIAYKDGVLAVDRGLWIGSSHTEQCKLHEIRSGNTKLFFAGCGELCDTNSLCRWIEHNSLPEYEKPLRDLQSHGLLFDPGCNAVFMVDNYTLNEYPFDQPLALGSGSPFAFGALRAGADPVQAVSLAVAHTDDAAYGVNWCSVLSPQINLLDLSAC